MQNFRREILKRYGGKRANKPTTFTRSACKILDGKPEEVLRKTGY